VPSPASAHAKEYDGDQSEALYTAVVTQQARLRSSAERVKGMETKYRTRREFLLRGGFALTGTASVFQLLPQTPAVSHDSLSLAEKLPGTPTGNPRLRGLMVDAGRVPESLEYYKRIIDFCADWEFNALQFRLADDQGCALRFSSAPDLLFHKNAFAPEQIGELAQYARRLGVDLIPELESFGHTGYITRSPAYAHLLDAESHLSSEFTGVVPVHPETLELFKRLYREISAVFPSVFLHGGCDEVNWGGSSMSRRALQSKQRYEIWADYLNSLNQIAVGLDKRFIVWGDFVLHKEPRILGRLSKSIVVMDWNYREKDSAKIQETLSTIGANGSRAIGAPGLINYRWGPRAGKEQLANIDAFADAYLRTEDASSLGVILTNWVPSRYLQNSIWDGFAYAAVGFTQGATIAHQSGFRRFVEKHYGANWNDTWDEAFRLIYETAPQVKDRETAPGAVLLEVPWSDDEKLAAVLKDRSGQSYPFTRLRGLLVQLERQVIKNLPDYQSFSLSVRYLEQLYWRETIVVEHSARTHLTQQDADLAIKSIAERDRSLAEALSRDWDEGRFSNSEAKLEPLFGLRPKDQLVFQWQRATDYSAALASHPELFFQILRASQPA
jgi:hypothetical protein